MSTINKDNTQQRHVTLYMEANPNPNSLKFVANFMLVPEGESFDFPDMVSAENAPLAKQLLTLAYVDRVFYMSNFVTVTKKEDADWDEIKPELKNIILSYLESGQPVIDIMAMKQAITEEQVKTEHSDIDKQIIDILDEYVKPAVESDGGAISFHSYQDGVVKVLLQGSCSGCPSSTITLKAGIENLLKRMLPEIQSVEAEGV